jgi:hypothetical protein
MQNSSTHNFIPGETPSGQQPKYDTVQFVLITSHPSKLGPVATLFPSGQQPYVEFEQSSGSGIGNSLEPEIHSQEYTLHTVNTTNM